VVRNSHAASEDDITSNFTASGNSHVSANESASADLRVVSHHDEIIDFCGFPQACSVKHAPVNGRVCADINPVSENHVSNVANATMADFFIRKIPKTIASEDDPVLDQAVFPKLDIFADDRSGVDDAILS
jgi:hypothetical protein